MNKKTCLIHRRGLETPQALSNGRIMAGRRFLFGHAAILAALTLGATFAASPSWAEGADKPAKTSDKVATNAPKVAASQLTLGKSMRVPMAKGAAYELKDGSTSVRLEEGDGFLLITPLEAGRVDFSLNGVPYAVSVKALAQTVPAPGTAGAATSGSAPGVTPPTIGTPPSATAPAGTVPSANAPSSGGTQPVPNVPVLTPVAPDTVPLTAAPSLPALSAPPATGSGVPAGMAPVSPQISAPLPPPARTPTAPAFRTVPSIPRNINSSGVPIKTVNVTKGLASILTFKRNILSVYFSDAVVMDARALNARTLAVTGTAPGRSTLAVFTATSADDAVGQLTMFHIQVDPPLSGVRQPTLTDATAVEAAIRSAVNDPRVQVVVFRSGDGTMVARLTGQVREAVESKAAEDTAALYAGKVINGIVVDKNAISYDQSFLPPTTPLTPEEIAQNQLRTITGNQTIELTPLGGNWVLKGEVGSQTEAQQLLTLAGGLSQKIVPLLVVRGPNGVTPAEQPITSPEDREMTRRLQEVTGIASVYAMRTADNGVAIYGSVRNRREFERVQQYKVVVPVNKGGGSGGDNQTLDTQHPTHGYQSPANVQVFVRIEDPEEAALRVVTIDSNVVEISRTALKNLGVEYGSAQVLSESTAGGVTTRTIDPQFQNGVIQAGNGFAGFGGFGIIDAFRARLNALYTRGNANILSKPNVTTLEGTEAQITIGGARPIPQIQSGSGGTGTVQENIIFRRFGVILTMRPTVLADNTIILQIRVDVTDLDTTTGITRGNTFIPGETVRSVNNVLVLKEGDIIALGGLITNVKRRQTSRVPVLSQIPIIGSLFQSRRFENNESELAIFLSPTIRRVNVHGEDTEKGLHATGWPKLSGIDDGQGLGLNTTAAAGTGGGGGGK